MITMVRVLLFELLPWIGSFKFVRIGLTAIIGSAICFGVVWWMVSTRDELRDTKREVREVQQEKRAVEKRIETDNRVSATPHSEKVKQLLEWAR